MLRLDLPFTSTSCSRVPQRPWAATARPPRGRALNRPHGGRRRGLACCAAKSDQPVAGGGTAAQQEQVEYVDSLTDIAFIGLCRKAYGRYALLRSAAGRSRRSLLALPA